MHTLNIEGINLESKNGGLSYRAYFDFEVDGEFARTTTKDELEKALSFMIFQSFHKVSLIRKHFDKIKDENNELQGKVKGLEEKINTIKDFYKLIKE